MYNHSLFSADRSTHLKIMLVPLVVGALLAAAAVNARPGETGAGLRAQATVRAGHGASLYASRASGVMR
jgi:hypothetical protein